MPRGWDRFSRPAPMAALFPGRAEAGFLELPPQARAEAAAAGQANAGAFPSRQTCTAICPAEVSATLPGLNARGCRSIGSNRLNASTAGYPATCSTSGNPTLPRHAPTRPAPAQFHQRPRRGASRSARKRSGPLHSRVTSGAADRRPCDGSSIPRRAQQHARHRIRRTAAEQDHRQGQLFADRSVIGNVRHAAALLGDRQSRDAPPPRWHPIRAPDRKRATAGPTGRPAGQQAEADLMAQRRREHRGAHPAEVIRRARRRAGFQEMRAGGKALPLVPRPHADQRRPVRCRQRRALRQHPADVILLASTASVPVPDRSPWSGR